MSTTVIPSEILVVSSLPKPLPSNGTFSVTQNIAANTFMDPSAIANPPIPNYSTTYSNWILNPADLIGTSNAPYAPVALPAYVSTLYQNVYNINNSLKDDISVAANDNREFPTSYAVQKYVQSQLSGVQVLNASDSDSTAASNDIVNTTVTNTIIENVTGASYQANYVFNLPTGGSATSYISVYTMDTSVNSTRNGASKIVVYADNDYFITTSSSSPNYLQPNGNVIFLYAGDGSNFIVAGQKQKYYQFTFQGDFVQFITAYDTASASWSWLVTGYQSVFSNAINISGTTSMN
jgi:hypothetical protein